MERLVVEFKPFVTAIAVRVRRQFNLRADRDELEACGFLGLLEAHDRYDPGIGTTFATFAYYRVRGKILDASRQLQWGDPRTLKRALSVNSALARDHPSASLPPSIEAAERTPSLHITAKIYLLADIDDAGSSPALQLELIEHAEMLQLLRKEIALLPKLERCVIERHHIEGATMEEVGLELGWSVSWVSRTNSRALARLRDNISAKT